MIACCAMGSFGKQEQAALKLRLELFADVASIAAGEIPEEETFLHNENTSADKRTVLMNVNHCTSVICSTLDLLHAILEGSYSEDGALHNVWKKNYTRHHIMQEWAEGAQALLHQIEVMRVVPEALIRDLRDSIVSLLCGTNVWLERLVREDGIDLSSCDNSVIQVSDEALYSLEDREAATFMFETRCLQIPRWPEKKDFHTAAKDGCYLAMDYLGIRTHHPFDYGDSMQESCVSALELLSNLPIHQSTPLIDFIIKRTDKRLEYISSVKTVS